MKIYLLNNIRLLFFLLVFIILDNISIAQNTPATDKTTIKQPQQIGTVSGRVVYLIDEKKQAVEFASISVLSAQDSVIISGTLTNKKGEFNLSNLPLGLYLIRLQAIGFKTVYTVPFSISQQNPFYQVGEIVLQQGATALKEVTITGQREQIEYRLDKRIYNVKQNLNLQGGTAVDALSNVPSVTVQADGSVQLRGSEKILVLIDGKPSALTGNDRQAVLNQMPASMIESVEVITSPSAKYDAEASAGIINIITKRNKPPGFNTQASFTAGYREKYNSSFSLNWRKTRFNFLASYDFIRDNRFVIRNADRETFGAFSTFLIERENGNAFFNNHNIRLGTDYNLTKRITLSATVLAKSGSGQGKALNQSSLFDSNQNALNFYTLSPQRFEKESTRDITLGYRQTFAKKGKEFTADFVYLSGATTSQSDIVRQNLASDFETALDAKTQWQNLLGNKFYTLTAQTDYLQPTGKTGKLGMGLKFSNRNNDADFKYNDLLLASNQFILNPNRSNQFVFDEKAYAGYLTFTNDYKKLNYSIGIRGEGTVQSGEQQSAIQPQYDVYNYFHLFPSALFNYQLNSKQRINLGVTRRINRTGYSAINPFISYLNPYNLLSGNADIKPELVNSVELGHLASTSKGAINTTFFYRYTNNQVARIRSVVDSLREQNVTIMTIDNVNNRSSYGMELVASQKFSKIWSLTANISAFKTSFSGNSQGMELDSKLLSFVSRVNNSFKVGKDVELQAIGVYRSPMPTAQGSTKSIYFIDFGAKKSFLNKRGAINLRFSDVFNTLQYRVAIRGTDFLMNNPLKQESRVLFLGLSYNFSQQFKAIERRERKVVNEGRAGEGE